MPEPEANCAGINTLSGRDYVRLTVRWPSGGVHYDDDVPENEDGILRIWTIRDHTDTITDHGLPDSVCQKYNANKTRAATGTGRFEGLWRPKTAHSIRGRQNCSAAEGMEWNEQGWSDEPRRPSAGFPRPQKKPNAGLFFLEFFPQFACPPSFNLTNRTTKLATWVELGMKRRPTPQRRRFQMQQLPCASTTFLACPHLNRRPDSRPGCFL